MSPRKRSAQGDEARKLPVRQKRRKTNGMDGIDNLEESLLHIDQPIAKRALRSSQNSDVAVRLNDHGSPELAQERVPSANPRRSHVKFGSESPPPAAEKEKTSQLEVAKEPDDDDASDSSDNDEAPEAISHSLAEAKTKAAQAEETRLLKQKGQIEKEKRRRRDAQLKSQAQSSEKRRIRAGIEQEKADVETAEPIKKDLKVDMDKLPEFLPEELLAVESPARPLTPPPVTQKNNTKKFMEALRGDHDDEAPSDVLHRDQKIRVLQTTNQLLPPRGNLGPKNLRESWMQGRAAFQKLNRRGSNMPAYRRRAAPQAFVSRY
ncbi:uncharacterized protein PV09_06530 [Verruconis gallopava]|uniref:Uncharacterized protein n=1 Tax=Verruconis gallopava TaxID=253628 RepID=A0A0D2AS93_9PEZI|nr:uncharacterized protein PV09_06530 [Verruconis gallopava]KIW02024.1 hypothetical protein PV09_06530 [Verruconis gallopava]